MVFCEGSIEALQDEAWVGLMRASVIAICALLSAPATAGNFTWNGVFTQGLFHTDHNNLYGQSERDVSLDYTEFSLNASYNFPDNLRLSG